MEAIVPLFALGSLYVVNQKQKSKKEGFNSSNLPNVSIPDKNYNNEVENVLSNETDNTTKLSTVNKYKGEGSGVYTDKYFDNSGYKSAQNIDNQYTSLTGENVNGSYFEHNNMVPFFGSNLRSAVLDENINESILDNYTGSGSQDVVKQEQAPLFEPSEKLQLGIWCP